MEFFLIGWRGHGADVEQDAAFDGDDAAVVCLSCWRRGGKSLRSDSAETTLAAGPAAGRVVMAASGGGDEGASAQRQPASIAASADGQKK